MAGEAWFFDAASGVKQCWCHQPLTGVCGELPSSPGWTSGLDAFCGSSKKRVVSCRCIETFYRYLDAMLCSKHIICINYLYESQENHPNTPQSTKHHKKYTNTQKTIQKPQSKTTQHPNPQTHNKAKWNRVDPFGGFAEVAGGALGTFFSLGCPTTSAPRVFLGDEKATIFLRFWVPKTLRVIEPVVLFKYTFLRTCYIFFSQEVLCFFCSGGLWVPTFLVGPGLPAGPFERNKKRGRNPSKI